MNPVHERLKCLGVKIGKAEAAQRKALAEAYPVGTLLDVYLGHGQVNPTRVKVTSHTATVFGGEVVVEISGSTARGSRRFRGISLSNIVGKVR